MTDMDPFERLVAQETQADAGPSRPTDVAAVVRSVATNSPRWRIHPMFNATKMLVATVVVAVAGGLLLALPLQPATETAVSPAAGEPQPPVEFEARWLSGGARESGLVETADDGWIRWGEQRREAMVVEPGDPRLDGRINYFADEYAHGGVEFATGYYRIENDAGAWQQRPTVIRFRGTGELGSRPLLAVFDGEGAYDGLTAIMSIGGTSPEYEVAGVILDRAIPPAPEIRDFYD